jgi:hypothetical protein
MKKEIIKTGLNPNAASLRKMPEIDFAMYRIRRNPYAVRIAREGLEVAHRGPSAASLKEMPEGDFSRGRARRNKYAAKTMTTVSKVQYGKGRPFKGEEIGPTPSRSLRLPEAVWRDLEKKASERATTVHALLRELVLDYVSRLRP